MKTKIVIILTAVGLGVLGGIAQDAPDRPPRDRGPGPGGQGGPGPRFVPPLMRVLDANGDGIIDEQEIANASAALKKLDKNGDGKLTPDELRPPPGSFGPGRGPGPEGGPRPNRPQPPKDGQQ